MSQLCFCVRVYNYKENGLWISQGTFVSNGFVSVTISAKFTLLGHVC